MSAPSTPLYYSYNYPNEPKLCEPGLFTQQTNKKIAEHNHLKTQIIALASFAVLASFSFFRAAKSINFATKASDLLNGHLMISGFFTALSVHLVFSKLNQFFSDFQEIKESIGSYPKGRFRLQEKITSINEQELAEIRACFPENFDLKLILGIEKIYEHCVQGGENWWRTFRPLAEAYRAELPQNPEKFETNRLWMNALLFVARSEKIPLIDKQAFIREIIFILDPENASPFATLPSSQNIECKKQPSGNNWLIQFRYGSTTVFCDPTTIKSYLGLAYP